MLTMFTCDIWKSSGSMSLVGVYTDKRKFAKDIRTLLKNGRIDLNEDCEMPTDFGDHKALNNALDYLFVQEIESNELI